MNQDTVYNWLFTVSGYDSQKIIKEKQLGPIPSGDFITFGVLSISLPDYEFTKKEPIIIEDEEDEEECTLVVYSRATYRFSINCYSDNGYSVLNKLKMSIHNPVVRAIFKNANVTMIGMSDIRDLTKLADTIQRYRYQADFTFKCNEIEEFTIDRLNSYVLTGEFEDMETTIELDLL